MALSAGGPSVPVDMSRLGILAIHRPVGSAKGFVLSHFASGQVLSVYRLKKHAVAARKLLESLDWTDLAKIQTIFEQMDENGTLPKP